MRPIGEFVSKFISEFISISDIIVRTSAKRIEQENSNKVIYTGIK